MSSSSVHGGAARSSELATTSDLAAMSTDSDAAVCCICLEEVDYNGTMMVRCGTCAIHVHVRCYGLTVPTDGSLWHCEACQYVLGKLPEPFAAAAAVPRLQPQCAICPAVGGALRRTNQPGVWAHVLCVNWIPELSHSRSGELNEVIQIGLLDRSRESLRCLVCGVRGGCIQCVSGRCARAFHVLCAIRAPSSLIFTGYNSEHQQVYHCKTHLSDVVNAKYEVADDSWMRLPRVTRFLETHPRVDGKCRVCQIKTTALTQQTHEAQCLLQWLTTEDLKLRRDALAQRGLSPTEITYTARGKAARSNGKQKRQHAVVRPCPDCGASVRETQMMSHLKSGCTYTASSESRPSKKNPSKMKRKMQGQATASASVVDLTVADHDVASDLSDVLFASWPGQSAGSPMDATYLWRVVHSHFYSSKTLMKRRMEQLCKTLCGAKLEDIGNFARKPTRHDVLDCTDTVLLERIASDSAASALLLKAVIHRCDFMMRASRTRCLDDIYAQPQLAIHALSDGPAATGAPFATAPVRPTALPVTVDDGASSSIRVLFRNDDDTRVDCTYAMQVATRSGATGASAPPPATDGGVWSSFRHDAASTLAGSDVESSKVPIARDDHLWVSMAIHSECESAPTNVPSLLLDSEDVTPRLSDELTPEISFLLENLREQMKLNRYRLRALSKKLQLQDHNDSQFQRTASVTETYYKDFASWKRLCKSLAVGYRDIRDPVVLQVADVKKPRPHDSNASSLSQDNDDDDDDDRSSRDDDGDPIDDGTCVVCFDGQSPETNPIVFCDRCDLAVHQGCYGIVELPSNEFYCDRCSIEDVGDDPASSVFCQLCSLRDGAFKRTVDGKWVHVVCALWCPKVWIGDLQHLAAINLVAAPNQAPRFVDTAADIAARLAAPATGAASENHKALTTGASDALEQGSLCRHCRVACGRTIQCSHEGCTASFHPLCGWFEGLPMTIQLRDDRSFVYAGGGAGLHFSMHCDAHLPAHYSSAERLAQRRRRRKFRIDAFYLTQCKVDRSPATGTRSSSRHDAPSAPSLLAGPILQAVLASDGSKAGATELEPESFDWIDRAVCGACFQYSAPVVSDAAVLHVDKLHKRQFLMRCQYCSTFIHPECCLSDTGRPSAIVQSNWICERCILVGQATLTPCLVCDKACDYLMPCSNPPGSAQAPLTIAQRVQAPASDAPLLKWVHVFCGKWTKAKTVRKNRILYAHTPSVVTDGIAVRCELCARKGVRLSVCL